MIFDNIKNAKNYCTDIKGLKKGFDFILNTDLVSLECGRHELGDGIYANVQELETKMPHEAKFEAHREFIDIQYVILGEERMDFSLIENFVTSIEYDREKDVEFFNLKDDALCPNVINVKAGEFAVFYPQDCHAPMLSVGDGTKIIKKVIVKVPVSLN